jgi:U3 small nucleolar RNA-associated protein 3
MTEADFGFDESEWAQAEDEQAAGHGTVVEKLPDVVVTEDTPAAERLKILKSRYPELEPLARDYAALQSIYEELRIASTSTQQLSKKRKADQGEPAPSIALLKWRALSTYLGSIAMYFAIFTAPASGKSEASAPLSPAELRQHPVMQSLLRSRQSWDAVKDLQLSEIEESEEDSDAPPEEVSSMAKPGKVVNAVSDAAVSVVKPPKKSKKSTSREAITVSSTNTAPSRAEKRSKSSKLNTLDSLISSIKAPASTSNFFPSSPTSSDFGDELPLTTDESLSKAARKRNLRFYTSQLAQKSSKRNNASQNAGGDADLPYKERLKDRQVRLLKEAEGRGKGKGEVKGPEMDFRDDDSEEEERVNGKIDAVDEVDEYYQTLSTATQKRKSQKASHAASLAFAATSRQDASFFEDPTIDASAKRAITYEISANKGLMPRRKKEVRNPRVKKRMKYDQKMKKLGSVRQVYKGGEGRGGYAGELTGIKTNVIKSVKL